MVMGIRRRYTEADVAHALAEAVEAQKGAVARWLCYVGEAAVAEAREGGSYTDRTGNLRSSVGYVVSMDGRAVQASGFGGAGGAAVLLVRFFTFLFLLFLGFSASFLPFLR